MTFWHWASVSPYTSSFELAETCVFAKQSPEVFCCGPNCLGQSLSLSYGRYFAEFLNEGSLDRLGLLDPPTCVGLRYEYCLFSHRGFSSQFGSIESSAGKPANFPSLIMVTPKNRETSRICQRSPTSSLDGQTYTRSIYHPASPPS